MLQSQTEDRQTGAGSQSDGDRQNEVGDRQTETVRLERNLISLRGNYNQPVKSPGN